MSDLAELLMWANVSRVSIEILPTSPNFAGFPDPVVRVSNRHGEEHGFEQLIPLATFDEDAGPAIRKALDKLHAAVTDPRVAFPSVPIEKILGGDLDRAKESEQQRPM